MNSVRAPPAPSHGLGHVHRQLRRRRGRRADGVARSRARSARRLTSEDVVAPHAPRPARRPQGQGPRLLLPISSSTRASQQSDDQLPPQRGLRRRSSASNADLALSVDEQRELPPRRPPGVDGARRGASTRTGAGFYYVRRRAPLAHREEPAGPHAHPRPRAPQLARGDPEGRDARSRARSPSTDDGSVQRLTGAEVANPFRRYAWEGRLLTTPEDRLTTGSFDAWRSDLDTILGRASTARPARRSRTPTRARASSPSCDSRRRRTSRARSTTARRCMVTPSCTSRSRTAPRA